MKPKLYQLADLRLMGRIYNASGRLIVPMGDGKTLHMEVEEGFIKTSRPRVAKDLPREVARWARGVAIELLLAADRIEKLKDNRQQLEGGDA
jgi:hypothetical protein